MIKHLEKLVNLIGCFVHIQKGIKQIEEKIVVRAILYGKAKSKKNYWSWLSFDRNDCDEKIAGIINQKWHLCSEEVSEVLQKINNVRRNEDISPLKLLHWFVLEDKLYKIYTEKEVYLIFSSSVNQRHYKRHLSNNIEQFWCESDFQPVSSKVKDDLMDKFIRCFDLKGKKVIKNFSINWNSFILYEATERSIRNNTEAIR